jgi:Tfp pilus assembly protein PilV
MAAETGDTLIEIVVSAFVLGLIVIGTLAGLNSTNRATALDRSRSQADALAQQDEDQLRSQPIKKLDELEGHPETKTVTENGTVFTINTTAEYISDATATTSCTSSSPKADYLQTRSEVTWPSIGAGKPVVETGVISPPADSALIVQVTESGSAPVKGAEVRATGPTPALSNYELETSADGCAIVALPPGGYELNASKIGYVDPNWYKNTDEDAAVTRSVYIPAETTSPKESYYLAKPGEIEVHFVTGSTATAISGDSFVAFNSGMSEPKIIGTVGTYAATVASEKRVYPFKSKYTVYAGTCEADLPTKNGQSSNPEEIIPTEPITAVSVYEPAVKIKVMSGTGPGAANEGTLVTGGAGSTTDGCGAKRSFATTPSGALPNPGLPFGKFTMCVGYNNRRWEGTFENNTTSGPSSTNWTNGGTSVGVATIYLGTNPGGAPTGTSVGSCP